MKKGREYKLMFITLYGLFFFYLKIFILKMILPKIFVNSVFNYTHMDYFRRSNYAYSHSSSVKFFLCPCCILRCIPLFMWFLHKVRRLSIFPSPAGGKISNSEKVLHYKAPQRRRITALTPVTGGSFLCFVS